MLMIWQNYRKTPQVLLIYRIQLYMFQPGNVMVILAKSVFHKFSSTALS